MAACLSLVPWVLHVATHILSVCEILTQFVVVAFPKGCPLFCPVPRYALNTFVHSHQGNYLEILFNFLVHTYGFYISFSSTGKGGIPGDKAHLIVSLKGVQDKQSHDLGMDSDGYLCPAPGLFKDSSRK